MNKEDIETAEGIKEFCIKDLKEFHEKLRYMNSILEGMISAMELVREIEEEDGK